MRWRRVAGVCAVVGVLAAGVAGAELVARRWLGLGDPPLYVRDSEIDYMLKPSGDYQRFGFAYKVNAYGMRAEEPAAAKGLCELRVLAVGDSVINGGVTVDQTELATTLLQARLSQALHRPVWVGNVSAGGWAPENEKAYLDRFGWFEADIVVFVFGSSDLHQRSSFAPDMGPNFPERAPSLALVEAAVRYLPRYLPVALQSMAVPEAGLWQSTTGSAGIGGEAILAALLQEAKDQVGHVVVAHQLSASEMKGDADARMVEEGALLKRMAMNAGVDYLNVGEALAGKPEWRGFYRDDIHLSAAGQDALAGLLTPILADGLRAASAAQPILCAESVH